MNWADQCVDRFVRIPRDKLISPFQESGSIPSCRHDLSCVSGLEEDRSAIELAVCECIPELKSRSVVFEDDSPDAALRGHRALRMRAVESVDQRETVNEPGVIGIVNAGESSTVGGVTNALVGLLRHCEDNNMRAVGFSGPLGFFQGVCVPLSWGDVKMVMNRGGSDVVVSGTYAGPVDGKAAMDVCSAQKLTGLAVIAGPTDMRWVAELADIFAKHGHPTTIVGIPKSKNANFYIPRYLPITLGFDSARRSLGELAGNIAVDSASSTKYWHFICCGDAALTMEVSLTIRATLCIAREDLEISQMSLAKVIEFVADLVCERQRHGHFSGVVMLSDGFVRNHSDIRLLCTAIESLGDVGKEEDVLERLEKRVVDILNIFPTSVQRALLYKRNNGRCVLPHIEPEKFLGRSVAQLVHQRGIDSASFAVRYHYMGREASCCVPSPFDCELGMALGLTAGCMVKHKIHGYLACIQNLSEPVDRWVCSALPFAGLCENAGWMIEKTGWHLRHGIRAAYAHFRRQWIENSAFCCPGPLQFTDENWQLPLTLLAETKTAEELIRIVQPVDIESTHYYSICSTDTTRVMHVSIRNICNMSLLETQRLQYAPRVPSFLLHAFSILETEITGKMCNDAEFLQRVFPYTHHLDSLQIVSKPRPTCFVDAASTYVGSIGSHASGSTGRPRLFHGPDRRLRLQNKYEKARLRIGILFGGNQVPGTNTVVAGLFDYLQSLEPAGELIGFLGGWHGLITGQVRPLTAQDVALHRNLGGQDLLCQFKNTWQDSQVQQCLQTLKVEDLDGLVVTGHLSTHLKTACIAEACEAKAVTTRVVACPVSAESDFAFVQQSVGKDTVAKVFSSIIGALGSEAKACRDKWYFARMRSHGGVGCMLECALQAQVTQVILPDLLGKQSLGDLIQRLCDFIMQRAQQGKNFGVILLPDTLLACISETQKLLREMEQVLALLEDRQNGVTERVLSRLTRSTQTLFKAFPVFLQEELCSQWFDGLVDLSNVSTEKLILSMVNTEMDRRRRLGYEIVFNGSCHELSYQGRSAMPTNFDCDLAYSLGFACGILVDAGRNGYLVHASNLRSEPENWALGAIPLTSLVTTGKGTDGSQVAVMESTIDSNWTKSVLQRLPNPLGRMGINPGPIQFSGYQCDTALTLSDSDPTAQLIEVARLMAELQSVAATAEDRRTVEIVAQILDNGVRVLRTFKDDQGQNKSMTV